MNHSDIYSQIVFNRTAERVTQFESQHGKPPYSPAWILKVTWDHVLPVSYQKINLSEVRVWLVLSKSGVETMSRHQSHGFITQMADGIILS